MSKEEEKLKVYKKPDITFQVNKEWGLPWQLEEGWMGPEDRDDDYILEWWSEYSEDLDEESKRFYTDEDGNIKMDELREYEFCWRRAFLAAIFCSA